MQRGTTVRCDGWPHFPPTAGVQKRTGVCTRVPHGGVGGAAGGGSGRSVPAMLAATIPPSDDAVVGPPRAARERGQCLRMGRDRRRLSSPPTPFPSLRTPTPSPQQWPRCMASSHSLGLPHQPPPAITRPRREGGATGRAPTDAAPLLLHSAGGYRLSRVRLRSNDRGQGCRYVRSIDTSLKKVLSAHYLRFRNRSGGESCRARPHKHYTLADVCRDTQRPRHLPLKSHPGKTDHTQRGIRPPLRPSHSAGPSQSRAPHKVQQRATTAMAAATPAPMEVLRKLTNSLVMPHWQKGTKKQHMGRGAHPRHQWESGGGQPPRKITETAERRVRQPSLSTQGRH